MRSAARTVREYLAGLPADRRKAVTAVRKVIREHLPDGYEEVMNWGMITYQVPLATCPNTYNGQPLMYAALASQKNHMAVYLTGIYSSEGSRAAFERAYRATGKRFDVGQSCVRFRTLDDLPLPLIGETIASLGGCGAGGARPPGHVDARDAREDDPGADPGAARRQETVARVGCQSAGQRVA